MRLISLIALLFIVSFVDAQNNTALVQRINEIKSKSDVYFWDQFTHHDADTAKTNATRQLLLAVNSIQNNAILDIEELVPYVNYICVERGKMKQYFVYIKKDEAIVLAERGASRTTTEMSNGISNVNNVVTNPSHARRPFVPDIFVQRIMEIKSFLDVYSYLKSLQNQGRILQFGKLKDVEDYSSLDLILFDIQSQEIITMLSPETNSGNRLNVVTGTEDSLDNYPTNMTAVIWYIKK